MSIHSVNRAGPLLDDPELRAVLARCGDGAARLRVIADLRARVIADLQALAARVPTVPDRIIEKYLWGCWPPPVWELENNELAIEFTLAAKPYAAAAELRLLRILRACIDAQEAGDVPVYAEMAQGARMRKGRPRGAVGDKRAYVKRLVGTDVPRLSARKLYSLALDEADTDGSPFGREDGELWDRARECVYPFRDFEKLVSEIRTAKKPKNPKKR